MPLHKSSVRAKRNAKRNKRSCKKCKHAHYYGVASSAVTPLSPVMAEEDLLYLLLKKELSDMESMSLKQKIDAFLSNASNEQLLKTILKKVSTTVHSQVPKLSGPMNNALSHSFIDNLQPYVKELAE